MHQSNTVELLAGIAVVHHDNTCCLEVTCRPERVTTYCSLLTEVVHRGGIWSGEDTETRVHLD